METTNNTNLDDLFIAWSEDQHTAAPRPLTEWIAAQPECAAALIQWTAAEPVLEYAASLPENAPGEAKTRAVGRQVLAEMRARYTVQSAPVLTIISLQDAAKAQGKTLKTLARQIGIGFTVACKLQDRLIHAATVPQALVQRLADALGLSGEQVRAYLQQPPRLAAGAMYKSDGVPQAAAPQDFTEAVETAADMLPADKNFWQTAE